MSWSAHHTRSQEYASQAEVFYRQQDLKRAADFYRLAAEAETKALESLAPAKVRTIGITAVSATALYYKAQELEQAKQIANQYLLSQSMPSFAVEQLQELLQVIHQEESITV